MSEYFPVDLELAKTSVECNAFCTLPFSSWLEVGPWKVAKLGTVNGYRLAPQGVRDFVTPEVIIWNDPVVRGWRICLDQEIGVNLYENELAARVRAWQVIDQRMRLHARDQKALAEPEETPEAKAARLAQEEADELKRRMLELAAAMGREMFPVEPGQGDKKEPSPGIVELTPEGMAAAGIPSPEGPPKGKPLTLDDIKAAARALAERGGSPPPMPVGPKRASLLGLGDIAAAGAKALPPGEKKWRKIFGKDKRL